MAKEQALAGNSGGKPQCTPNPFPALKTMGRRSTFFLAAFLAAAAVLVSMPKAAAQFSSGLDQSGCSSGIFSSVDGSCVGGSQSLDLGQQANPQGGLTGGAGVSSGQALGLGALGQQYPGLQGSGMNLRVPTFRDQGGLPTSDAQREALVQRQALAQPEYSPPTDFQRLVRASLGGLLPIYGDSLFQQVPWTFAPLWETPVTPDYVLGPGDQLLIRIWGKISFNSAVTVDRSGAIYLPQVGNVQVAGLKYSDLQQHLRDAVSRIYKNFDLSVEMGQLRAIQVFVVGQARRPGSYTLSSLSTLVTAIFATGGPSVQGSLRDIQLKRNGKTVTHFDLYDLLLHGDKSKDVSLLPGDVIYIPPVGPQVAVAGSVRNPAIYELKDATSSVGEVLQLAGGLSSTASLLRASLERIDAHKDRSVVDVALQGAGLQMPLREGDILRVLPISPQFQNTVTLRGNVAEPGRFSWHPGMKLSDVIPDSQSLITRDYWESRNRLGIPGPAFKPEYAINPDLYQRGGAITAAESAAQSGTPEETNPNTGIAAAQNGLPANPQSGFQPPAQGAGQPGGQTASSPASEAPGHGALGEEAQGTFAGILPKPRLNIALPVPEIDWSYAVIERLNPQTLTTSLVPFNLGELVQHHDASQDLDLQPGDVVTIFSQADIQVPQAQRTKYVRLEGEFKQAGVYSVHPGETLRELVERAGGLTPDAYLFGSDFARESTRAVQQQRLNDYLLQLELEIDRSTIATASASMSPQDAASASVEAAASRSLVTRFRSLRATGRIVLNLTPDAAGIASIPDLPLEDGDSFIVPSKPNTVNVVGAVYDENAFLFQPGEKVKTYLHSAGGATRNADPKHAFIIRADGSVVSRPSQSGVFGNTFASTTLNPGDTVVVPEKVPKLSALRNIANLSQIFSQLAFGAAAIAVLR